MPFKHNAPHRDKFEKAKYRVTNWPEYNESLRRRGDETVWFCQDAVAEWRAQHSGKRGAERRYSDVAIEVFLTPRVVFHLALRQTQGFVRSLLKVMDLDLPVPDFSTLCRRAQSLKIATSGRAANGPITLIVDSTGLRVHGGRDWMAEKHGLSNPRKTWRKLHIEMIAAQGRLAWQEEVNYGLRSHVEAQIGRSKMVIGTDLKSRKLESQTTETQIAVKALNRMTHLGRAVDERVARSSGERGKFDRRLICATWSFSSSSVMAATSRCLGSQRRSRQLVFSTVPFCQGEEGLQNHVWVPSCA